MKPCKFGHTEGRFDRKGRLGECIECNRLRMKKRDRAAEYARERAEWKHMSIRIDQDTLGQVKLKLSWGQQSKRRALADWVREAIEWRMEQGL